MNSRNVIPWIVAAVSMLFAMVVLIRNEIAPQATPPVTRQYPSEPSMQAYEPAWRPSQRPPRDTPPVGDYSPWSQPSPTPSPTITPSPTPAPTPTPTPTPKPVHMFQGIVLDGDNPVKGAMVRVVSGVESPAERSAVTGTDGRFIISQIPDDVLSKVIVEAQGYSVTLLENVPLPLPSEMLIGVNPLAGIDVVVLDFSSTTSEPILFSGQMRASLMKLTPGGVETTNPMGISEPVLPVDTYLPVRDQQVAVRDGELRFDNVEPGQYRVAVKTGQKVAESESLTVTDGFRTSTTLTLGMKHTVKGNVVGKDTGKPISQARVGLSPYDMGAGGPEFPDYLSFTDGAGEFVIPEVQPGRYWLMVGASGYTTKSLEGFTVLPGTPPEDTSVTLTKQEPLITVAVTASDNRPMAGAPLVLMTAGAESPRTYFGKTDEAGLYRFERLLPGRYTLSVTAPGESSRQKTVNVDLGEGEVRELRVSFGTPTSVTGKARVGGKPYKGVLSFVAQGASIADSLITTEDNGNFTTELEPGQYMVGTPDKPSRVAVEIDAQPTQNLTVDIP